MYNQRKQQQRQRRESNEEANEFRNSSQILQFDEEDDREAPLQGSLNAMFGHAPNQQSTTTDQRMRPPHTTMQPVATQSIPVDQGQPQMIQTTSRGGNRNQMQQVSNWNQLTSHNSRYANRGAQHQASPSMLLQLQRQSTAHSETLGPVDTQSQFTQQQPPQYQDAGSSPYQNELVQQRNYEQQLASQDQYMQERPPLNQRPVQTTHRTTTSRPTQVHRSHFQRQGAAQTQVNTPVGQGFFGGIDSMAQDTHAVANLPQHRPLQGQVVNAQSLTATEHTFGGENHLLANQQHPQHQYARGYPQNRQQHQQQLANPQHMQHQQRYQPGTQPRFQPPYSDIRGQIQHHNALALQDQDQVDMSMSSSSFPVTSNNNNATPTSMQSNIDMVPSSPFSNHPDEEGKREVPREQTRSSNQHLHRDRSPASTINQGAINGDQKFYCCDVRSNNDLNRLLQYVLLVTHPGQTEPSIQLVWRDQSIKQVLEQSGSTGKDVQLILREQNYQPPQVPSSAIDLPTALRELGAQSNVLGFSPEVFTQMARLIRKSGYTQGLVQLHSHELRSMLSGMMKRKPAVLEYAAQQQALPPINFRHYLIDLVKPVMDTVTVDTKQTLTSHKEECPLRCRLLTFLRTRDPRVLANKDFSYLELFLQAVMSSKLIGPEVAERACVHDLNPVDKAEALANVVRLVNNLSMKTLVQALISFGENTVIGKRSNIYLNRNVIKPLLSRPGTTYDHLQNTLEKGQWEELTNFKKYLEYQREAFCQHENYKSMERALEIDFLDWQSAFIQKQAFKRVVNITDRLRNKSTALIDENYASKTPFAIVTLSEKHAQLVLVHEQLASTVVEDAGNIKLHECQDLDVQHVPTIFQQMVNGLQVLKSESLVPSYCVMDSIVFFDRDNKIALPSEAGQALLASLVAKDRDEKFFLKDFSIVQTGSVELACRLDFAFIHNLVYCNRPLFEFCNQIVTIIAAIQKISKCSVEASYGRLMETLEFVDGALAEHYGAQLNEFEEVSHSLLNQYPKHLHKCCQFVRMVMKTLREVDATTQIAPICDETMARLVEVAVKHSATAHINPVTETFKARALCSLAIIENLPISIVAQASLKLQSKILATLGQIEDVSDTEAFYLLALFCLCHKARNQEPEDTPKQLFTQETAGFELDPEENRAPKCLKPKTVTSRKRTYHEANGSRAPNSTHPSPMRQLTEDQAQRKAALKLKKEKMNPSHDFETNFQSALACVKLLLLHDAHDRYDLTGFVKQGFSLDPSAYPEEISHDAWKTICVFEQKQIKQSQNLDTRLSNFFKWFSMEFCKASTEDANKGYSKALNHAKFIHPSDAANNSNYLLTNMAFERLSNSAGSAFQNSQSNRGKAPVAELLSPFQSALTTNPLVKHAHNTLNFPNAYARYLLLQSLKCVLSTDLQTLRQHLQKPDPLGSIYADQVKTGFQAAHVQNCHEPDGAGGGFFLFYDCEFVLQHIFINHSNLATVEEMTHEIRQSQFVDKLIWLATTVGPAEYADIRFEDNLYARGLAKVVTDCQDVATADTTRRVLTCKQIKWHLANGTLPLAYLDNVPILLNYTRVDDYAVVKAAFWRSYLVRTNDVAPIPFAQSQQLNLQQAEDALKNAILNDFKLKETVRLIEQAVLENKCAKFLVEVILLDSTEGVLAQTRRSDSIPEVFCLRQVWKCAALRPLRNGAEPPTINLFFQTPHSNYRWITLAQAFDQEFHSGTLNNLKCLFAMNFVSTVTTQNDANDQALALKAQFMSSFEIFDHQIPIKLPDGQELNKAHSTGTVSWVYTPEALLTRAALYFAKKIEHKVDGGVLPSVYNTFNSFQNPDIATPQLTASLLEAATFILHKR